MTIPSILTQETLIISVKVRKGKRSVRKEEGHLVVYTDAKREQNRANLDVMRQLAEFYHTDVSKIRLIKGQTNTNKIFRVEI